LTSRNPRFFLRAYGNSRARTVVEIEAFSLGARRAIDD
jgi:hypothetical protein